MKLKLMQMDFKLAKLIHEVDLCRTKYNACHYFWKNEYYQDWMKARANLKAYVGQQEIKITVKFKQSVRMDDWSEKFENFIN